MDWGSNVLWLSNIFKVVECSFQVMFYLKPQFIEERKAIALGEAEMEPAPMASLLFPTAAPKKHVRIM